MVKMKAKRKKGTKQIQKADRFSGASMHGEDLPWDVVKALVKTAATTIIITYSCTVRNITSHKGRYVKGKEKSTWV